MSSSAHSYVLQAGGDSTRAPLVLLHGSYGTEFDLLPMAERLSPGAPRLGVRGTLPMDDGYAFFRRDADRRVDETDIEARVPALVALIQTITHQGHFTTPPVLVGFSNGATMAAALVATHPEMLAGAILFRPLSPFTSNRAYRRGATPVLIVDGAHDPRRAEGDGGRLAERLAAGGAVMTHRVLRTGHSLTAEDEEIARTWLDVVQQVG